MILRLQIPTMVSPLQWQEEFSWEVTLRFNKYVWLVIDHSKENGKKPWPTSIKALKSQAVIIRLFENIYNRKTISLLKAENYRKIPIPLSS